MTALCSDPSVPPLTKYWGCLRRLMNIKRKMVINVKTKTIAREELKDD
jgi:hypothetical protein